MSIDRTANVQINVGVKLENVEQKLDILRREVKTTVDALTKLARDTPAAMRTQSQMAHAGGMPSVGAMAAAQFIAQKAANPRIDFRPTINVYPNVTVRPVVHVHLPPGMGGGGSSYPVSPYSPSSGSGPSLGSGGLASGTYSLSGGPAVKTMLAMPRTQLAPAQHAPVVPVQSTPKGGGNAYGQSWPTGIPISGPMPKQGDLPLIDQQIKGMDGARTHIIQTEIAKGPRPGESEQQMKRRIRDFIMYNSGPPIGETYANKMMVAAGHALGAPRKKGRRGSLDLQPFMDVGSWIGQKLGFINPASSSVESEIPVAQLASAIPDGQTAASASVPMSLAMRHTRSRSYQATMKQLQSQFQEFGIGNFQQHALSGDSPNAALLRNAGLKDNAGFGLSSGKMQVMMEQARKQATDLGFSAAANMLQKKIDELKAVKQQISQFHDVPFKDVQVLSDSFGKKGAGAENLAKAREMLGQAASDQDILSEFKSMGYSESTAKKYLRQAKKGNKTKNSPQGLFGSVGSLAGQLYNDDSGAMSTGWMGQIGRAGSAAMNGLGMASVGSVAGPAGMAIGAAYGINAAAEKAANSLNILGNSSLTSAQKMRQLEESWVPFAKAMNDMRDAVSGVADRIRQSQNRHEIETTRIQARAEATTDRSDRERNMEDYNAKAIGMRSVGLAPTHFFDRNAPGGERAQREFAIRERARDAVVMAERQHNAALASGDFQASRTSRTERANTAAHLDSARAQMATMNIQSSENAAIPTPANNRSFGEHAFGAIEDALGISQFRAGMSLLRGEGVSGAINASTGTSNRNQAGVSDAALRSQEAIQQSLAASVQYHREGEALEQRQVNVERERVALAQARVGLLKAEHEILTARSQQMHTDAQRIGGMQRGSRNAALRAFQRIERVGIDRVGEETMQRASMFDPGEVSRLQRLSGERFLQQNGRLGGAVMQDDWREGQSLLTAQRSADLVGAQIRMQSDQILVEGAERMAAVFANNIDRFIGIMEQRVADKLAELEMRLLTRFNMDR